MREKVIGSAVLLGLLLSSASSQTPPKAEGKPAPDLKRSDLFGPDKLWTIHLKLGAKEYAAMPPKGGSFGFPNPKKDEPAKKDAKTDAEASDIHKNKAFGLEFPWVKGDLEFDGRLIKDVGIRYKGNATYGVSQQTLKRPFKIAINHYLEAQHLHGLNGFALGNNAFDPTRLHDALAYHLFRAAKVPASRTAFVKLSLTVDDKYDKIYVGVYTMMEPVDKAFLREYFGSDKGMLLKPERIPGLLYLGEKWDAYKDKYNPKREPTDAQKRRLIEFTKLVNQPDDATFNQKIGEFLDIDEFLRFAAVNSLISNLDGFFAGGHNYFLYLNPKDNRFHFMPWDLDVTFGGHPFARGDQSDWSIAQPYMGKNRLTERVLAVKANNDLFRKHARTLIAGPFSVKEMKASIDAMEATIKEAIAKEPPPKFGMGFPVGKQIGLREFVAQRIESVLAQLDGKSNGSPLAMGFGPGGPKQGVPDDARRHVTETLGPRSLVFRDKVQEELKLSDEQKKKLEKRLQDIVQDAMQFFQNLQGAKPEERQLVHHAYVEKAQEKLTAFLEGALNPEQFKRLRQVMLQREGLFALGHAEIVKELEITDKQRQQFSEVVQEMQKKIEPLLKEAQKGGNPEEIRPKVMKIRAEHEGRIEALLSDAQKKQWKEMLGKPLDLAD
jgi:spore coat protein H